MPDLRCEAHFPDKYKGLNRFVIQCMLYVNGIAHVVIGIALALAVVMFTWLFFSDVYEATQQNNLIHGFIHALGSLMILYTISLLITTEIKYLRGHKFEIKTFVELALMVVLRKILVLPVQEVTPTPEMIWTWVGSSVALGFVYIGIKYADAKIIEPELPDDPPPTN